MLKSVVAAAALLVSTGALAEDRSLPADLSNAATRELAQLTTDKCRQYLALTSRRVQPQTPKQAWAEVTQGLSAEARYMVALTCHVYSDGWVRGGQDLSSAMQGERLTKTGLPPAE